MESQIIRLKEKLADIHLQCEEDVAALKEIFLDKEGTLSQLLKALKDLPLVERKRFGPELNLLKQQAARLLKAYHQGVPDWDIKAVTQHDSLPLPPAVVGEIHPLRKMEETMVGLLESIGFTLVEGPEVEDEWHNFTALNIPAYHPARQMQDTFFLADDETRALRTHTSSVQIRVLENQAPPVRIISSGRVFRHETISARSHCMFHQLEGLYVDREVSFADLKATLNFFMQGLFGQDTQVRLRPSFFPFTEPSAEVDVSCLLCKAKGCTICKGTGWVEIGGAGLVDPQVLLHVGIDPELYSGFAFGMGLERTAMLLYQIPDVRLFTTNDLRFLQQRFGGKVPMTL